METNTATIRRFSKRWPTKYSHELKPVNDQSALEEMSAAIRSSGEEVVHTGIPLFMESYEDDLNSKTVREVLHYCKGVGSHNLLAQLRNKEPGTAWLDDRSLLQPIVAELPKASVNTASNAIPDEGSSTTDPIQHSAIRRSIDHSIPSPIPFSPSQCTFPTPTVPNQQTRPRDFSPGAQTRGALCATNSLPPPLAISLPIPGRQPRTYKTPLTADELYIHLREKRFNHPKFVDADRRIVYIADPDAYDFSALAHTAPGDQKRAVKHVFSKYFTLEASIKVAIPEGFSTFQIEFHIPYFVVRLSCPGQHFDERKKRTHRGWMNAAFLELDTAEMSEGYVLGIHQAQMSFTLCGSNNKCWAAYFLEDRHFDEDSDLDDEHETGSRFVDPITTAVGPEAIIWDAREYFIRALRVRVAKVRHEWAGLVAYCESGLKQHSWGRSFFSMSRDGIPNQSRGSTPASIDSILILLGKALEDIAKTNDTWTRFLSETGDLAYFSDLLCDEEVNRIFCELANDFDDLKDLEKRLRRVEAQCEKRTQALNVRYAAQSFRIAQLMIYFISPFATVAAFFAIPVPMLSFERNIASFFVGLLIYVAIMRIVLSLYEGRLGRLLSWEKACRWARDLLNRESGFFVKEKNAANQPRRQTTQTALV